MKKRQIWVLWLVVWQAITLFKKDPALREQVAKTPWFLGKAKVFGETWLKDNKEIFEDLKATDRDQTLADAEQNIKHDTTVVTEWTQKQSAADREGKGRETIRSIVSAVPNKKTLADWVEKYKQRIVKRRDAL